MQALEKSRNRRNAGAGEMQALEKCGRWRKVGAGEILAQYSENWALKLGIKTERLQCRDECCAVPDTKLN